MDWKHRLAYIAGTVDQELLRNEYLVTENRILRNQITGRVRLTDGERTTLAAIGQKLGKRALAEVAKIVTPDTILAWHRKLVAQKFDGSTQRNVLPQSAGGSDETDNLALACRNCNERRGNRVIGRDPETEAVVPLFNPRSERWADHCGGDATRLRIVGRTPTGCTTVAMLDLNDEHHEGMVVRIRQRNVADGYHPPPEALVLPA